MSPLNESNLSGCILKDVTDSNFFAKALQKILGRYLVDSVGSLPSLMSRLIFCRLHMEIICTFPLQEFLVNTGGRNFTGIPPLTRAS